MVLVGACQQNQPAPVLQNPIPIIRYLSISPKIVTEFTDSIVVEFEYKDKGKAIPPPKDRQPSHTYYTEVKPTKGAHISEVEEKPAAPAQKEEAPKAEKPKEEKKAPVEEKNPDPV